MVTSYLETNIAHWEDHSKFYSVLWLQEIKISVVCVKSCVWYLKDDLMQPLVLPASVE